MWWAAVFWILYGVGSTLFVIYLFKLGKSVASNRRDLVEQKIVRLRTAGSARAEQSGPGWAGGETAESAPDHTKRLHVQRMFLHDDAGIAMRAVRSETACPNDLRIGQAVGMLHADTDLHSPTREAL